MIVTKEFLSALLGFSKMSVTQEGYGKIVNNKIATRMAAFLREVRGKQKCKFNILMSKFMKKSFVFLGCS